MELQEAEVCTETVERELTIERMTLNLDQLTSFPDVALKIDSLLEDESKGAEDFAEVIRTDPALSAALIRLANSAMYNTRGVTADLDRAVVSIGLNGVRDLAYGICVVTAFDGIPNELVTLDDFWNHSLYCAVTAKLLEEQCDVYAANSMFSAGLLHDIGQLVMYNQEPEKSRQSLELSLESVETTSPCHAESTIFGFDHTDVGVAVARRWGFPSYLIRAIQGHHTPYDSDIQSDAAIIVHVANSLAVLAELESSDLEDAPAIENAALQRLGLNEETMLNLIPKIRSDHEELIDVFTK